MTMLASRPADNRQTRLPKTACRRLRPFATYASRSRTASGSIWCASASRIVNGVRLSRLRLAASTRRSRRYGMSAEGPRSEGRR